MKGTKNQTVLQPGNCWMIYIEDEGHWPIEHSESATKAEATEIYLKWAGRKFLPKGAYIDQVVKVSPTTTESKKAYVILKNDDTDEIYNLSGIVIDEPIFPGILDKRVWEKFYGDPDFTDDDTDEIEETPEELVHSFLYLKVPHLEIYQNILLLSNKVDSPTPEYDDYILSLINEEFITYEQFLDKYTGVI